VAEVDPAHSKPIEHRPPTPATIKQLHGTAFRCAEPSCTKVAHRLNNYTGEWLLDSRVGPRLRPQ
jgi:hypothetical protein